MFITGFGDNTICNSVILCFSDSQSYIKTESETQSLIDHSRADATLAQQLLESRKLNISNVKKVFVGICAATLLQFASLASANDETLEQLKGALASFTGVQYAMMGDVVFLHGTTDNIAELGNIVNKLMSIEGVSEVRTNITKKMQ